MATEPQEPHQDVLEVDLKTLENELTPEEKERAERIETTYQSIIQRMIDKEYHTALAQVSAEGAQKFGFKSLPQFNRAHGAYVERKSREHTGTAKPVSDALGTIYQRVEQVAGYLESASTVANYLREGLLREARHYAADVVDNQIQAEQASQIDPLTGLIRSPDAVAKRFEIERQHFFRDAEPDEVLVWVEIDLDHFKELNTELTHSIVDNHILKPLAKRLEDGLRGTDVVCRLGGDEFSVILNNVKKTDLENVLQKIQALIKEPFSTPKGERSISASIGALAMDRTDLAGFSGTSPAIFMEGAREKTDMAVESVKQRGKDGYTIYSPDLKALSDTETVYAGRYVRALFHEIARVREELGHAAADQLQKDIESLAKKQYTFLHPQATS